MLEHGTLRYFTSGHADSTQRDLYLEELSQAQHLWVTNLDEQTLDAAERLMAGKWSALPHPYVLDERAPFPTNFALRDHLLKFTGSTSLVFLPSSLNMEEWHNKGTSTALASFKLLHQAGARVGLVLVRWGLSVSAVERWLADQNLETFVFWMEPQPRITLQQIMASVDVVWDQFALEAMGGLAIKCMEQGAPLVSRGISARGLQLIGEPPNYLTAATPQDVAARSLDVIGISSTLGLSSAHSHFGLPGRNWLVRRHHHEICRQLQVERYRELLTFGTNAPSAHPDAWSHQPDYR